MYFNIPMCNFDANNQTCSNTCPTWFEGTLGRKIGFKDPGRQNTKLASRVVEGCSLIIHKATFRSRQMYQ